MFTLQLFGYFRLEKDNIVLDESTLRSDKLLKLFAYLIMNRDHKISNVELERHLWAPNEIENPTDALKNLMCRLRNVMAKTFGEKDYFRTVRGSYSWNDAYEIQIDVEQFNKEYLQAKQEKITEERRLLHLKKAFALYEGLFLTSMEDDYWVNNLNMEYHSAYIYVVEQLYQYFWDKEDYIAAEELCTKALAIDEFDEKINLNKMRALLKQNKVGLANKFYYSVEKNTTRRFGSKGSLLLRNLKREMNQNVTRDLVTLEQMRQEIQENLVEGRNGCFLCDYEEFKILYSLQAKRNQRRKEEGYVILFQGMIKEENAQRISEVKDFLIQYAMDGMEQTLLGNLREFDVISRCSDTQYIVMLDRCSYENAINVAKRLVQLFKESHDTKFVDIRLDVQKINLIKS